MTTTVASPPRARRRLLLAVAGLVAVLVALWLAAGFLKAEAATARFLAGVYDLVGLDQQAALMEQYGLNPTVDKLVIALVALVVGIAGIWALFISTNAIVDELGSRWMERVRPWVFVVPAAALLGFYLVFPTIRTLFISVTDRPEGTGLLENYAWAFTESDNLIAMRNNVVWLVLGTGGSVLIGLAFATLVDRVRREALAKTFIFLPLAISMVGAAVVWRFMYYWRPPGQPQIGFLNAIITGLGGEPFPFFQTPPVNTLALIVIMVWLQVGFAMVVLSAAIKGVSTDLLEAARIDGAGELADLPPDRGAVDQGLAHHGGHHHRHRHPQGVRHRLRHDRGRLRHRRRGQPDVRRDDPVPEQRARRAPSPPSCSWPWSRSW